MSEQEYRQCELLSLPGRHKLRIAWLPKELAQEGHRVRVGVQHWPIVKAHKTAVTMEFLGHVRDDQKQRESTVR